MTSVGLSLLILAAGWTLYRLWLRTRYRALKDSGHPQYFAAVVAAAYLLLIACSFRLAAKQYLGSAYNSLESALLSSLPTIVGKDEKENAVLAFASVTAWSLLLVYPMSLLLNAPILRSAPLLRAIVKKAGAYDQLEAVTSHVLERAVSLAVTLDSGKVYIGAPITSSTFDEERRWLAIFPLVSGMRDERGRLELTTKYMPVYEHLLKDLTPEKASTALQDFQIVLPLSKIQTFQVFDLPTYNAFRSDVASENQSGSPESLEAEVLEGDAREEEGGDDDQEGFWTSQAAASDFSADELFRVRIYYVFMVVVSLTFVLLPHVPLSLIPLLAVIAFIFGVVCSEPE